MILFCSLRILGIHSKSIVKYNYFTQEKDPLILCVLFFTPSVNQ